MLAGQGMERPMLYALLLTMCTLAAECTVCGFLGFRGFGLEHYKHDPGSTELFAFSHGGP